VALGRRTSDQGTQLVPIHRRPENAAMIEPGEARFLMPGALRVVREKKDAARLLGMRLHEPLKKVRAAHPLEAQRA
jgi:hypothetical protein